MMQKVTGVWQRTQKQILDALSPSGVVNAEKVKSSLYFWCLVPGRASGLLHKNPYFRGRQEYALCVTALFVLYLLTHQTAMGMCRERPVTTSLTVELYGVWLLVAEFEGICLWEETMYCKQTQTSGRFAHTTLAVQSVPYKTTQIQFKRSKRYWNSIIHHLLQWHFKASIKNIYIRT